MKGPEVRYAFRKERRGKQVVIEHVEANERVLRSRSFRPVKEAVHPVARRLALAYYVERCLESGLVASYADAARRLGITRARMSQVMDLRLLPVEVQDGVLLGELRPTKEEIRRGLNDRLVR